MSGRRAVRERDAPAQHPSARKKQGTGSFSNCEAVIIFQLETMNSCQHYLFWNSVAPMSLLFKEKSNFYSIPSSLKSISHRNHHRFTAHAGHARSGCGDVLSWSSCEIKISVSFICRERLSFQMRRSFHLFILGTFFFNFTLSCRLGVSQALKDSTKVKSGSGCCHREYSKPFLYFQSK